MGIGDTLTGTVFSGQDIHDELEKLAGPIVEGVNTGLKSTTSTTLVAYGTLTASFDVRTDEHIFGYLDIKLSGSANDQTINLRVNRNGTPFADDPFTLTRGSTSGRNHRIQLTLPDFSPPTGTNTFDLEWSTQASTTLYSDYARFVFFTKLKE